MELMKRLFKLIQTCFFYEAIMIRILIGDILQSKAQTIVNTVNCVGIMGKGLATEFKTKYFEMFEDYKIRCAAKQVKMGKPYLYPDKSGIQIINFPTKNHWRSSSLLIDIINGLDFLISQIENWKIKSIAIPPLGCGNGGLEWKTVGPIMYQKLSKLNIPVEIYAPYGAPQNQLEPEFLLQKNTINNIKKHEQQKINPTWLTILEVLDQLTQQPYANPVGRTIFQKIAYILTELGVETGFQFNQASYGPYSADINRSLKLFTNMNLLREEMLGRMITIHVGSNYHELRKKNADILNKYSKYIAKTVDLFSRIKTTEQAEEVATVLFSTRVLKKKNSKLSEQQLLEYIIEWKKTWNNNEKMKAVVKTIRNLEMLRWLTLQYSDTGFFANSTN